MGQVDNKLMLQCEYLNNPIGIQNEKPRFSWVVTGDLEDSKQISYHLFVKYNDRVVWDSKQVISNKSTAVVYDGELLHSRRIYNWIVAVEVEKDGVRSIIEEKSTFETGIFTQAEWKGSWIRPSDEKRGRVPLIRRLIELKEIPETARLYVCGLGYCEVTINGKKVGSGRLDPGWTDYNKTILYRVYDVKQFLVEGQNVLGLEIGEGWYGLEHVFFEKAFNQNPSWNGRPKVICNLWLDDECIYTVEDGKWLATQGPILENNIYDGEVYDANLEKIGWNTPQYEIQADEWKQAINAKAPNGVLRSQIIPEIGENIRRKPVYVAYVGEDMDYSMVLDFGQNMAGWIEVEVSGKPGTSIEMKYAEVINEDGTVNQKNLRYAKARDIYTIGKEGKGYYHPRFTYHGFRYVQINMEPGTLILSVEAVQVSSKVEKIADFNCSDELVNKIYNTVMKTEENNIHSVPTDCPQRDERLGWVNDMTIRYENAIYNYDMMLMFEKWMQDLADSQSESGAIPDTAPYFFGNRPGSHITSVFVLMPWCLYSFSNDKQILTKYYDNMKRYVEFKLMERDSTGLLPEKYFGEWAPPMTEAIWGWGENAIPRDIPQPLITTAYLCYDCMIMKKISRVLGHTEDEIFFEKEFQKIKDDINKKFYHKEGYYGTGSQGSNTMPLFLNIIPEGSREKVLKHLINNIIEHDYHLTTGNQMTKLIYEILVEEGEVDKALSLTTQTTYPSIGYMLSRGATSIWERWEELTCNHMNSHNHPMLGAFSVWLLKGLGGLRPIPGESQYYFLRPSVPEKLDYVKIHRKVSGGVISLQWIKKGGCLQVEINVPWNTDVKFEVPKGYEALFGQKILLKSGHHSFNLKRI